MLLGLLLSDPYSAASGHPVADHSSISELLEPGPSLAQVRSLTSPSSLVLTDQDTQVIHLAQRQVTTDPDGVISQQYSGLRTEHMQRLRDDQPLIAYTLLCEWSMQLVWLLLSGLAFCLPLLYKKHSLQERFSQFTDRLWNPKHLQYRFCHSAG